METRKTELEEIRELALEDLWVFANVVNPHYYYGDIHKELFYWWQDPKRKHSTLTLIPRDHLKSHCVAVKTLWHITKDPTETVIYVSATTGLAHKQLFAIKQMMMNPQYQELWPDMVNARESQRSRWRDDSIIVDHPDREASGQRDDTIFACGINTNMVGRHCSRMVLDDLLIPDNTITPEQREKVEDGYSYLASIQSTGCYEDVVGTRYHPKDLYQTMLEMKEELYDRETQERVGEEQVFDVFLRQVEINGNFLWPRQVTDSGKAYGFDRQELERKRAKYTNKNNFYSQYYNDPNAVGTEVVDRSKFKYFNPDKLQKRGKHWYLGTRKLNLMGAIDFAFSTKRRADYTAIVVIGMDWQRNVFVLDMIRFKTEKISEYVKELELIADKWDLRDLRAEVTVAQKAIVTELKSRMRDLGLLTNVHEIRPMQKKEERMESILVPRYDHMMIYHDRSNKYTRALEEEVLSARPAHDDLKDTLSSCIEGCKPPGKHSGINNQAEQSVAKIASHPKFGGVR